MRVSPLRLLRTSHRSILLVTEGSFWPLRAIWIMGWWLIILWNLPRLLLLTTEDTLTGAMCSRMWHCRTYNRAELRRVCAECGLKWERELWFSRLHAALRLGGIIVELRRE